MDESSNSSTTADVSVHLDNFHVQPLTVFGQASPLLINDQWVGFTVDVCTGGI